MIDSNYLINKISEINNKYPNINYGGCGTFSYHLHKALKDNHGIDTEIVYIKSPNPPAGKPDYDVKFNHVMVKITYSNGDYYIDNNGFHKYTKRCVQEEFEHLPLNKLEEMINIPELWNDKFNHSTSKELINDIYLI